MKQLDCDCVFLKLFSYGLYLIWCFCEQQKEMEEVVERNLEIQELVKEHLKRDDEKEDALKKSENKIEALNKREALLKSRLEALDKMQMEAGLFSRY